MSNVKFAIVLAPVFSPDVVPMTLACLKGYLKKNGTSVEIIDLNNCFFKSVTSDLRPQWRLSCNRGFEDGIFDLLHRDYSSLFKLTVQKLLSYDILGFSCYHSNIKTVIAFCALLKKRKSRLKIILGGPEITASFLSHKDIRDDLKQAADFFVIGEGESALLSILQQKTNDKVIVFQQITDLSDLPLPDYDGINFADYPKKNSLPVMFSRGCIGACSFCSERLLYKNFRTRSVAKVTREIGLGLDFGAGAFIFHDSMINADAQKLGSLCDSLIANFGSIPWEAQIAVRGDMPEELFKKMKQSGCYNLFVGLESGSDNTLLHMNKGYNKAQALTFFKKLRGQGLNFGVSVITGFPGETEADFEETVDFLTENKDLIPKVEQINPFVCYRGTGFKQEDDYRNYPVSLKRAKLLIRKVKEIGYKHTNAFLLNLVDYDCQGNKS
jgi:radical SAM superfamily enzyme YgiQ (UPF0313 family)